MEARNFWHLQMHPNNKREFDAPIILKILEEKGVIGVGFEVIDDLQLVQFKEEMQPGDIVVVRSGHSPIALVQITGDRDNKKQLTRNLIGSRQEDL